jgi:DNA primase
VLKADSIGVHNVVALSKKKLSDSQRKMLIELQVDIVIALDNDVSDEDIKEIADAFIDFTNVYIIKDKYGLLCAKDSPFDCGDMVWDELYENKIKYIKE